jgi:hypothetical protein
LILIIILRIWVPHIFKMWLVQTTHPRVMSWNGGGCRLHRSCEWM